MSPEIRIFILLIINLLCYYLVGFHIAAFSFLITIYRVLSIYKITITPHLFQNNFRAGICYIKDYTGGYTSHSDVWAYMCKLKEEKNLNDFSLIALYYDQPQKDKEKEKQQRCSIGFYLKNDSDENIQVPEEIEKCLIVEEKFRKHNLVGAKSIYCCWDYFNSFTMMLGIKKFYSLIQKKINSKKFMNAYNIKKEQINVGIEVYENFFEEQNIHFYFPFQNNDKFFLYGKEKNE